jgi:hypothetical protein
VFSYSYADNVDMNEFKEIDSTPKSNINALGGWIISGVYGLLATVIWLGVILEGDASGLAGMVIYIFLLSFVIGHLILFLPFFLIFWRRRTSRGWLFRYTIPLVFFVTSCVAVMIKGSPIEELKDLKFGAMFGIYGSMLAVAYIIPFKLARKSLNKYNETNKNG